MPINGIETLVYAVKDVDECTRYFADFGLKLLEALPDYSHFRLPEGSNVLLCRHGHAGLPAGSRVCDDGVHEVIWGVDSQAELDRLAQGLANDRDVTRDAEGTVRFVTDFGVAMGLRHFAKVPVLCSPDPLNAPGKIGRLNTHRKWRERARPRGIAHVVFAVPDFEAGYEFMCKRLEFRLSDSQRGFGKYLRAPGTYSHHNLLLLNANAPIPGMDGTLRFHHANYAVEDIDEIMIGANYMTRKGWQESQLGLGRHRIDSALFYYLPCPAGGEAEYGADSDCVDDSWVPRDWDEPLFGYSQFVHNLQPFLLEEPAWEFRYITHDRQPRKEGAC